MFYIIASIVSLIIAVIPIIITIKNKDDLIDNVLYFIVVFISSIAFYERSNKVERKLN